MENKNKISLWLRDETKPNEHRTALTPLNAKILIENGFEVSVESSEVRCFLDRDYQNAGCRLVASGSWRSADRRTIILGLKELPDEALSLAHTHIYFAHAYKGQKGWQNTLSRFKQGGGMLFDMEYLVDDNLRRVAAFGYWAGFAGAALALDLWIKQSIEPERMFNRIERVLTKQDLLSRLVPRFEKAVAHKNRKPKVLIMGALGRCGTGAKELLYSCGLSSIDLSLWDKAETQVSGPYPQILDHDILINCVLLQAKTAPFLTAAMLGQPRQLSVISDVSCDPTNPANPLPFYEAPTTFEKPILRLSQNPVLDLTAIDHLPSLLPRESSEDYGDQLLPHLIDLKNGSPVWDRARDLFLRHVNQISLH